MPNHLVREKQVAVLAKEVLEACEAIAQKAHDYLDDSGENYAYPLAHNYGLDSSKYQEQVYTATRKMMNEARELSKEPSIARLECLVNGRNKVIYISRGTPLSNLPVLLASYRAEVGRLAALPPGETLRLRNGTTYTLLSKSEYRPAYRDLEWDARNCTIYPSPVEAYSVDSLLDVLLYRGPSRVPERVDDPPVPESVDDVQPEEPLPTLDAPTAELEVEPLVERSEVHEELELPATEPEVVLPEVDPIELGDELLRQFLGDEHEVLPITEGIKRHILENISLRDQPILDQFQDEIFRLPIQRRLFLFGPPGTGKTTTLIRRLGQKLDLEVMRQSDLQAELNMIFTVEKLTGRPHGQSWIMFTPTDLLKHYLREAFAREDVPAPSERITTWKDFSHKLARDHFQLLKTPSGGGRFIVNPTRSVLKEEAHTKLIPLFNSFDHWQRTQFGNELLKSVNYIAEATNTDLFRIGTRLKRVLTQRAPHETLNLLRSIQIEQGNLLKMRKELQVEIEQAVRKTIAANLARDRSLLSDLMVKLEEIKQAASGSSTAADELAEEEAEDEVEAEDAPTPIPPTEQAATLHTLSQVIRTVTKSSYNKNSISSTSRTGLVHKWLKARQFEIQEAEKLGRSQTDLSHINVLLRRHRNFIKTIPKRYRAFRRDYEDKGTWYTDGQPSTYIHPHETDLLLLAVLKATADFVQDGSVPAQEAQDDHRLFFCQVLVDEATDFSPLQLACMATLSHPKSNSFFACGDFNQRLTDFGTQSHTALKWAVPNHEVREITTSYRQSASLNAFARTLIEATGGHVETQPPKHFISTDVAPILFENASDFDEVVLWLAYRIREIQIQLTILPSIAILVHAEKDIEPLATALASLLSEDATPVMGCPNGQVIGEEHAVRIFDVQHIKGLEFEAVFFLDIDRLAESHPDVYDKYLYVGATRAATYLGVTCQGALPPALNTLRPLFGHAWPTP